MKIFSQIKDSRSTVNPKKAFFLMAVNLPSKDNILCVHAHTDTDTHSHTHI